MWKQVVGYEDYYEVSDTGEIRSVDRVIVDSTGKSRLLRGKIMKQSESMSRKRIGSGYLVVNLHKYHKSTVYPVHRLVAEAFIKNPNNYPTVNHIDGDKHNNTVDNLEWASYSMNNTHALENQLRLPRGCAVVQKTTNGTELIYYNSVSEASRLTGINRSLISHCVNGRIETAGGFIWEKIEKCNDYLDFESTPEDELPVEVQELQQQKI